MRQRIIWSLIAILGIPVIAKAEEPQVPPAATKNPLQQPAPSTPVIVERGRTMLAVQTTEPERLEILDWPVVYPDRRNIAFPVGARSRQRIIHSTSRRQ